MAFLNSLFDPHPENLAIVDGVRILVVKPAISFLFDSIRPKHRMPFWQLDSAFLYKELKELVSLGHIKVICTLGLLDLSLVHCQWLFAPHHLSCGYLLLIINFFPLISFFEELILDVSYIIVFGKPGVFLESISLISHQ
jgi:hypothetical protein